MRRRARLALALGSGAVATAVVVATLHGRERQLGLAVELLSLAAIWALLVARTLATAAPAARASARASAFAKPAELARVERSVEQASSQASELHLRLRPLLRAAAAERLRRSGLDLDSGDPQVRAALGDDGWELLRPGRERPPDPFAAGLPLGRLEQIVQRLEKL